MQAMRCRRECETMLDALFETTFRQLAERLSEFAPLLPDDDETHGCKRHCAGTLVRGFFARTGVCEHGDALARAPRGGTAVGHHPGHAANHARRS